MVVRREDAGAAAAGQLDERRRRRCARASARQHVVGRAERDLARLRHSTQVPARAPARRRAWRSAARGPRRRARRAAPQSVARSARRGRRTARRAAARGASCTSARAIARAGAGRRRARRTSRPPGAPGRRASSAARARRALGAPRPPPPRQPRQRPHQRDVERADREVQARALGLRDDAAARAAATARPRPAQLAESARGTASSCRRRWGRARATRSPGADRERHVASAGPRAVAGDAVARHGRRGGAAAGQRARAALTATHRHRCRPPVNPRTIASALAPRMPSTSRPEPARPERVAVERVAREAPVCAAIARASRGFTERLREHRAHVLAPDQPRQPRHVAAPRAGPASSATGSPRRRPRCRSGRRSSRTRRGR